MDIDLDGWIKLNYWDDRQYADLDAELQAEVPEFLRPDPDDDYLQELIDDLTPEEVALATADLERHRKNRVGKEVVSPSHLATPRAKSSPLP